MKDRRQCCPSAKGIEQARPSIAVLARVRLLPTWDEVLRTYVRCAALRCLSVPFRLFLHEVQFSFDPFRCSSLQPTVKFAMFHHSGRPLGNLTTAPWHYEEDTARSLSAAEEEVSHLG
jgi:hypothetical protein